MKHFEMRLALKEIEERKRFKALEAQLEDSGFCEANGEVGEKLCQKYRQYAGFTIRVIGDLVQVAKDR